MKYFNAFMEAVKINQPVREAVKKEKRKEVWNFPNYAGWFPVGSFSILKKNLKFVLL